MADKQSTLSIIIRAVNEATAEMRKITKDFKKFGDDVATVGKSITTYVTLPLVGMGAAGVAAFADFEKGMRSVSTLIDTNTESLSAMGREVLAIGGDVPVAIDDLTAGLYDLRSAGTSAEDQFYRLERSSKLAVAGLGTTKESVDIVTSSINAFKLEGDDANRVYDQIFKTVKFGKTTISGLSQGFGAVAGQVAATGTKLDEYLASVAALTTTGLPASQAHSQLRAVMAGLTRETEKTKAVFKALSAKSLTDLIAKSGGLVPALQRISDKLGGNQAHILELVGSTEALNAILGLTGAQSKTYAAALEDMRTGADAVNEAFEKQARTLSSQGQVLKNTLISAGVAIGEVLAPALTELAGWIKRAADFVNGLDAGTKKWVVGIGLAVAAIGPALLILGKLVTAFAAVKVAVAALNVVFLGTPVGWALAAIAGIAAGAYLLIKNWDTVSAFFKRLWERVRGYFEVWWKWTKFVFLNFTPLGQLIQWWGPIVHVFRGIWNRVRGVFEWWWKWTKTVFLNFTPLGQIIKFWEPIETFFSGLWYGVQRIFEDAWDFISDIIDKITGAVDRVKAAVESVTRIFAGDEPEPTRNNPVDRTFRGLFNEAGLPGGGNSVTGDLFLGLAKDVRGETVVKVEFANAPRGTRVAAEPGGTADVDLSVGYQMVMP